MNVPNPLASNFWRERILTDEEYAATIAVAKEIVEQERQKVAEQRKKVDEFLTLLPTMGYGKSSSEYKYVQNRIKPWQRYSGFVFRIEEAQRELKRKADEQARKAEVERQKRDEIAALVVVAKQYGVDAYEHFGDVDGLRKAIKQAKHRRLDTLLDSSPYYIQASFYGHCLRGDWSSGTRSYGYDELRYLDVPDADPDRPEIHERAKELVDIALTWDGVDGRDFRYTYQELDGLLNETDLQILVELNDLHYELNY